MNILKINSSSNRQNSISTAYTEKIIDKMKADKFDIEVVERHTTYSNLPFIDEDMLASLFVNGERTPQQIDALKVSQELVDEVLKADVIIISAPIYNFSVPASLKAYFDLIARAGLTFQYSESGPIGLLKNKKAFVVVSSGGTEIDSDMDFAGKYIKHFLGFIGITDVEMIKLDQLMFNGEAKQVEANHQIQKLQTV